MGKIQELPKPCSRLLTSSQIITSVNCVVKELIENALDSHAQNVEIKLENFGLDKIEVKDNGCGIEKNDIQFAARPHCTSKIASYSDLNSVNTYGFRGEALGAICAVSDLVISTKTCDENIGSISTFDHNGNILSTKPTSCLSGTTVSVLNLFKNLPVRKKYYNSEKNKKEELRKIENLLIAYGCILHNVRFTLYHNKNLIWQKSAVSSTKDALIQVLGNFVVDNLKYIMYSDEQTQMKIEAFLPKLDAPSNCGYSSSCRCLTAVNKRPVRMKVLDKLLKEYYNKSVETVGKHRYPICCILFSVPVSRVDVNIEPNKTSIMFHDSEEILEKFSEMLKDFYSSNHTINKNMASSTESTSNSSNKNGILNTTDFVSSLKLNCDSKIQQSLVDSTSSLNSQTNCMTKKDFNIANPLIDKTKNPKNINKTSELKEPCVKKMRTSFKLSSKDISDHINTINSFLTNEKNNDLEHKNNAPTIDYSITSVTVQRHNSDSNHNINSNPCVNSSATDNNSKTTALTDNANKMSTCVLNMNFDKSHPSETGLANDKTPVLDFQNENAWTRGMHSGGELLQPVSVLKPKSAIPTENSNETNVGKNTSIKANDKLSTLGMQPKGELLQPLTVLKPKSGIPTENLKETNVGTNTSIKSDKSLPLHRKLTAFDIFCRNHRLEVVAENPDFTTYQVAQILSEKWNKLSSEEKAKYNQITMKDCTKTLKKKEKLSQIISRNLNEDIKSKTTCTLSMKPPKPKLQSRSILCDIQQIRNFQNKTRLNPFAEKFSLINHLASGVWIGIEGRKLLLLSTFCLQETVIYYHLLSTFQFESVNLEVPQRILPSELGDYALSALKHLSNISNLNGNLCDERLTANGFNIKVTTDENNQELFEIIGKTSAISFYGVQDLKEILVKIKENESVNLANCRPGTVILFLQSEANRISRQSPVIQKMQDVEYLLSQKGKLPSTCNQCLHHKPFLHLLWEISENVVS